MIGANDDHLWAWRSQGEAFKELTSALGYFAKDVAHHSGLTDLLKGNHQRQGARCNEVPSQPTPLESGTGHLG
ncbi:hypothetical protein Syncc8109_1800 [Synechococcus sp. WH 8109]|nr:hypothetical protein Syncc8109_1800 [Synechococcus sp. WH 8109]